MLDEVRAFVERLRAHQATSADGLRVGRQLLGRAIEVDPGLARDGVVGNLTAVGAVGLLERTVPADDLADRHQLAVILEGMASALPELVEHAAAHLGDDGEDALADDKATVAFDDEKLEDDDEDDGFSLDDALIALDARLRVTEEADEAADVSFLVAGALLIQSVHVLRRLAPTFRAGVRAIAAGDALLSSAGSERGTDPFEVGEGRALLETAYSQAAALLEADVPGQPTAAEPVEVPLSELDELICAMQDVADQELVDELAGALALIGGAAQVLRAGVGLGHRDPDTQRRMAAALGVLDPLALADLPEVRVAAAQALRELARSVLETTATSAATR